MKTSRFRECGSCRKPNGVGLLRYKCPTVDRRLEFGTERASLQDRSRTIGIRQGLREASAVGRNRFWALMHPSKSIGLIPRLKNCHHVQGSDRGVGGFEGAVWRINAARQVYRFSTRTQNWDPI